MLSEGCGRRNDVLSGHQHPLLCERRRVLLWPHGKVLLVWNKHNKGAAHRCLIKEQLMLLCFNLAMHQCLWVLLMLASILKICIHTVCVCGLFLYLVLFSMNLSQCISTLFPKFWFSFLTAALILCIQHNLKCFLFVLELSGRVRVGSQSFHMKDH